MEQLHVYFDSNKTTLVICSFTVIGNVQSCRLLWRISLLRNPRDVRITFSLMNHFYLCFSITKVLLALEWIEGLLRCERYCHRYQQKRTSLWYEHRWVVTWTSMRPETFPLVETGRMVHRTLEELVIIQLVAYPAHPTKPPQGFCCTSHHLEPL